MAFRVEVSPRAFDDLDAIADHIRNRGSFERAEKWFNDMIGAIASLKDMPKRCPVTGESKEVGREVRLLLHGKRRHLYKVYFSVQEEAKESGSVQVLHVRHWAQHGITTDELNQLLVEADPQQGS